MNVAIRELKNRLSAYLRRVRAGEHVIVTDRGHPIAELHPVRPDRASARERLTRLEEAGDVTVPKGQLRDLAPTPAKGRPVSETLLEDRG